MAPRIKYCVYSKRNTQPLYGWDADNRLFHYLYDALRRPVEKWGDGRLLEEYAYGEGQAHDKDYNLRGQLYQVSDGAGQLTHAAYDFKGNLLETARQLLNNPTIGDVDWASSPGLSGEVFTAYATYDALSRLVDTKDPGGNVQEYTYDSGGYPKTVLLNGAAYVQDIHYDAKGQRQAIWYGNGTKTSYSYDAATFRLRRLLTVNLATNAVVQDLRYWYDPVGNITRIGDEAQQTLFYANQLVSPEQNFTYDALYRLIEASGREQIAGIWPAGMNDNWDDGAYKAPLGGDAAQRYTQYYTYDAVGNILELKHSAGVGSYTRTYGYGTSSNRLVSTEVGTSASSTVYTYGHDSRGNMTAMPHLQSMEWGIQNQLSGVVAGSVPAYYQYSSGERLRKYTDKGSVKEERIYLGSYEVYRKYDVSGNLTLERTTVHVSDDSGRIAMLETRTQGSDASPAVLTRYIYSNHLQSATMELDEVGQVISYEEYHPYGTTAFQASNAAINAVAKRYRFSGKERDEESGLYYHGARYYAPWLGRWTAVDPLESEYAPLSPYNYCFNNPVNFTDGSGMGPEEEKVIYGGQFSEVEVRATRLYSPIATPPTTLSVADNATRWQMNPERLQGDLEASRQAYLNSVMSGGLGGPYASFNPVSDYDVARREEYTRQREFQLREEQKRALDPFAYDMGRSPGVQAGLSLAVPGIGLAQGSAQLYSGLKTGSKTDMVLGGIGVVAGVRSLRAQTTSVPNFVQTKTLPNTELNVNFVKNTQEVAELSSLKPTHFPTNSKSVTQNILNDIRSNGIKNPLEYVEFEGVKYIVGGNHRYFIAQRLGIESVPVKRVQLPFAGYKTPSDFQLEGKMPSYWKFLK